MELTSECKNKWVSKFACSINDLADKYESSLNRGDSCIDNYLFKLELSIALNEILCSINIDEESCLTEEQICTLIENIKEILKTQNCGC